MSQQEKLNLIQNYFVIEQICIPRLQRELDSYPEGLGTTGIIKADLTKSDSEESGGSTKDQNYGDDFDRKSFPKPVKFITKSFDTIGSKLKNIAKTGKAGKTYRKGSVGVATQSTRMSNIAAEMFENQGFVVCARLRHRKTGYQDVMVRNYIDSMREKFNAQQVKRREQNAEIRRRSIERINLRSSAVANSSLNAGARGDTGGRVQQDLAEATNNQRCSYALPGSNSGSLQRQDTIVTAGKSKFYTVATEEQCPMVTASFESKKPNDAVKGNKGILKYNRFSAMQLESVPQDVTLIRRTQLTRKDDQVECSTLPRQAVKADDLEGASRRANVVPTRLISNRHTVVGNYLDAVSNPPPPLDRATGYTTNVHTDPQNKSDFKSFPNSSSNEPRLDVGEYPQQQRLCKAGDCSFYGTRETGFLCSKCFKSGKKPRLCHVANCQNEGDPGQDNLCKRCFQQKTYSFQVQYPMAQTKF